MRGLIENLSPENRHISWKWIGGVFAFYVVMMAAATGMFVVHQSAKDLTRERVAATAAAGKPRTATAAPAPLISAWFAINGQGK